MANLFISVATKVIIQKNSLKFLLTLNSKLFLVSYVAGILMQGTSQDKFPHGGYYNCFILGA